MLLVCLAAVFIGMATRGATFSCPALGAVVLNVVMIASVLFLRRAWDRPSSNRSSASPSACWWPAGPGLLPVADLVARRLPLPMGGRPGAIRPCARSSGKCCLARSASPPFQINVLVTYCFSFWFGKSIVRDVQLLRALDGVAAGHVRHFPGHLYVADARGSWRRRKSTPNSAKLEPGLELPGLLPNLIASAIALALAVPIVRSFSSTEFGPEPPSAWPSRWPAWRRDSWMFSMNNISRGHSMRSTTSRRR